MSATITADRIPLLLRQIASCRTEGKSWPEVAGLLKMTVEKVREFIWENEAAYGKILKRARKVLLEDCFLDAVQTLRQQTKSANEKIRQAAATCLTRLWLAQLRLKPRLQPKKAASPTPSSQPSPTPPPPIAIPAATSASATPQPIPALQAPSVKTISSDEVLKWLNEKKVGV